MNTNYNNNVAGALKLATINGSVYQLGKDASVSEGGISKLFGGSGAFETYSQSTDGSFDAATVYNEISAIKTAMGADGGESIADQIEDLQDGVAAAKSTIALVSGEPYLSLSGTADATDGHMAYVLSTQGIDAAISNAVTSIVNGAPAAFDTLKEISDWITDDTTGAATILAGIDNKANKVASATSGNFAGLDINGDIVDSGYNASSFQTAGSYKTTQSAVIDPTASGNATAFIDSVSQNANGEITVTKKNVQTASSSQAGLMSAANYNKLAAISASVLGDTLTIVTAAA